MFGLIIVVIFAGFSWLGLFEAVETRITDFSFRTKDLWVNGLQERTQAGAVSLSSNTRLSRDIEIVGIDNMTLAKYGLWPFGRNVHSEVLSAMTRITDQNRRESAVLLDFLFFDVNKAAYQDILLLESIKANGNVILQTQLYTDPLDDDYNRMGRDRLNVLFETGGQIRNVSGNLSGIRRWYGIEAPLTPYGEVVSSYGTATFSADQNDDVFRFANLISAYSEKVAEFDLEALKAGEDYGTEGYGHISFTWRFPGERLPPVYALPLSEETVEEVRREILKSGVERNRGAGDYYFTSYNDYFIPGTPLSLALQYFNRDLGEIEVVLGSHLTIPSPMSWNSSTGSWEPYSIPAGRRGGRQVLDELRIPIDGNGAMAINYMGRRSSISRDSFSTFPVRSFARVAEKAPGMDPSTWTEETIGWDGKIIMVGAFTQAMADDEKATPMGMMFGVEMQANALNTIIMSNFIRPAPLWANLIILLVMAGLAAGLAARSNRLGWSSVLVVVIILASYLFVTLMFIYTNIRLDWFTPFLATVLAFIFIVIYRVLSAERDKRQIKSVFGQFISPQIVEELSATHAIPELGGENRDVTVFFSDIRDYSGISEKLADQPRTLVALLNKYLTLMTDNIVIDFKGTLDKYIGDAIMAVWGAPVNMSPEEHAILACKSAVKQLGLLDQLNEEVSDTFGQYGIHRIDIGIGIHSGECNVGYMGSEGRKNYTSMGDRVNLASRLEGVNKEYSTQIIISAETRNRISTEPFIVRELDWIKVKGRYEPETIYELVGYEGEL